MYTHKKRDNSIVVSFSDPAGIRTQDPYIKSVLLYQLSYRVGRLLFQVNPFV